MADGAIQTVEKSKPSHHSLSTAGGIMPTTFEETWRIAEALSKSSLVRKDFQGKPENVMLVLMQGLELGLKPIAALTQIYVVDAVPSLSAKLKLALVRQSPVCEYITCTHSDEKSATFKAKRRDQPHPVELTFTIQDAQEYGLLGKDNWKKKKVMLRWRAGGQICDLEFSDVIGAVQTYDEARDMRERLVVGSHVIMQTGTTAPPPPPELPEEDDDSAVFDQVSRGLEPKPSPASPPAHAAPEPSAERTTETRAPSSEMTPEEKLHVQIDEAADHDQLTNLNKLIAAVKNLDLRGELKQHWTRRWNDLKKAAGK